MGLAMTESRAQVFSLLTRQMHGAIIWKKNNKYIHSTKEDEKLILYIIDEKYLAELRKHEHFKRLKKSSDYFVNPDSCKAIYLFDGTELELQVLLNESLGLITEEIPKYNFGNTYDSSNKNADSA